MMAHAILPSRVSTPSLGDINIELFELNFKTKFMKEFKESASELIRINHLSKILGIKIGVCDNNILSGLRSLLNKLFLDCGNFLLTLPLPTVPVNGTIGRAHEHRTNIVAAHNGIARILLSLFSCPSRLPACGNADGDNRLLFFAVIHLSSVFYLLCDVKVFIQGICAAPQRIWRCCYKNSKTR